MISRTLPVKLLSTALLLFLAAVAHANPQPDPEDCVELAVGQPVANKSDAPEPGTEVDVDGTAEVTITLTLSGECIKAEGQVIARSEDGSKEKDPQDYYLEIGEGGSEVSQDLTFSFDREDIAYSKKWNFYLKPKGSSETFIDYIEFDGCLDCGCEVTVKQGCFLADLFTPASNGGMTKGTLYFYAPDFTFPGRAGLTAILPPSFVVTRDANGLITEISTGNGVMEVQDGGAQDSITITYKDMNDVEYDKTVISLVDVSGSPRFRLDSTRTVDGIPETTTRHEQYEDPNGATVLLKGQMNGATFEPTWRETLYEDKTTLGIEIRSATTEERRTSSDPWEFTKSTQATWENQVHGWVKTKEVTDPDRPGHTGAKLTSTWSYYQPGETTGPGASMEGLGEIKQHIRYDGYESFHTYGLHYESVTTPYAGTAAGRTVTRTHNPGTNTTTVVTTIGSQITAKTVTRNVTSATSSHIIRETYTSAGEKLTTTTHYKMAGNDFILKPIRIEHPDGTLTTYSYTRLAGGGYTTETDQGSTTDGITVSRGTRTTSTVNYRGTTILSQTTAIGYGTGSAVLSSMAVTSIDSIGRALTTAYHPETATISGEVAAASNPAWSTTTQYNCCGVSSETDMYGIPTYYAYDGLKRRIKTNRLGVTTETQYFGLTTDTHRYEETVGAGLSPALAGTPATLVSRSVTNLAGTLNESWSPDPTSNADGDLVKSSSTATIYQPGAGLSTRTVTTTPDNFSQTTDSFLDGRTATTYGDLAPAMQYAYGVNAIGQTSSTSYLDGTSLRETKTTQTDWAGRTLSTTYMDNSVATVEYNAIGQMVKSTDPDGVVSLIAYNAEGKSTISAIDLNQNNQIDYGTDTVSYSETYPALDSSGDPVYLTTSKVWQDGDTNPIAGTIVSTSTLSPDGLSSATQSIGVTNPSTSEAELTGGGDWITTSTAPDGTYTVATYVDGLMDISENFDSTDTLITFSSMRDGSNAPLSGYDSLNRLTHQRDSRTGISTMAYLSDTADVVRSVTDPGSRTTAFTYDVRGRRTTVNAPDTLDADGNPLANVTTTSYFPDGRVQETAGGQTYRTTHTYDYANRQVGMTTYGTSTATTTWIYGTDRGFLLEKNYHGETDPGTSDADYTYTPAGRIATRVWERGVSTTYGYDAGGRLVSTDYSDATPDVLVTYDALGRAVETSNGTAVTTTTFDALTLAQDTETVGYDLDGNSTAELVRTIDRSHDSLNRPNGYELKASGVETAADYGYDDAGRLFTVGNGTDTFTYGYLANSNGLVETVTGPIHIVTNTWEATRNVLTAKENKAAATVVSEYGYGVNDLGQRTDVTQDGTAFAAARTTAWGYDSFGQVSKADSSIPGLDRAYLYDEIGNRLKSADSLTLPTTDNYTPNAFNQYTAVDSLTPAYDADGNATAYPLPANLSANSTLVWDGENRLIDATVNSVTISYRYDSVGRRIATVTSGGNATLVIYDGWNPIASYIGSVGVTPTLSKTNLWGMDLSGSMQGAGGVGGLLSVADGSGKHYTTYDGNGNVSEYLDSSGTVVAHYEYDPFGRTAVATGAKGQDFTHRFSTKPLDAETGLYYYGYRWYDPVTGRWPSRDPIAEMGGVNLYAFVGNAVTSRTDYLGFAWQEASEKFNDSVTYTGITKKFDYEATLTWEENLNAAGEPCEFRNLKFSIQGRRTVEETIGGTLYRITLDIEGYTRGDFMELGATKIEGADYTAALGEYSAPPPGSPPGTPGGYPGAGTSTTKKGTVDIEWTWLGDRPQPESVEIKGKGKKLELNHNSPRTYISNLEIKDAAGGWIRATRYPVGVPGSMDHDWEMKFSKVATGINPTP